MKITDIINESNLNEFVPPSEPGGGGENDRSRRLKKLLEIAIQVAKEKNVDELGMIHAMNMIAGDDFFNTAVEGILPDITDKEYMDVLQTAYKTVKQGMAEGRQLDEQASKLLSAQDKDGVITIIVQAPDGTKRSAASSNPNAINKWLMKYGLRLPKNIADLFVGVTEEFRPTTGQAMGIRSQIAQKMNPGSSKFIWKRPNQISGSHTENELRALKFRYSTKYNSWGGTKDMWGRLEGTLKELAPSGAGRGGDNYFKTLASAWYGGAYNTGSLQRGIKSKQDVERLLQQGIVCPDGVTRKFGIDYNATDDGVVISSDDYYEHSDHGKKPGTMIDVRTAQPWGPYDYMEFSDADLSEDVAEGWLTRMLDPEDSPEEAYELGQQAARDGDSEEDNPYEEGWTGPSDAMQAWHDGWTDARGEYQDDEEDDPPQAPPIKQLSAPVAVPTKTVAPPKTSGPADFSKRGFTGYKKSGDMEEGVRVPAQQILGTKNRAKSAYYPTNVKPKVPRLDTPLTDKELVRLSQLAGIDTNK